MKTYTIDKHNNVSVFASKKEAAAASATPFDPFTSASELAELAATWPASRLVEIWNSIPGVSPVTKFTSRKIATERIWKAIQNLGAIMPEAEAAAAAPSVREDAPESEPAVVAPEVAAPDTQPEPAIVDVQSYEVIQEPLISEQPGAEAAPVEAAANEPASVAAVAPETASPAAKPARRKKEPEAATEPKATRDGSKTAQVVAMLQREGGATLLEIMEKMGWQKHTVRGFMAGAMKKAGYAVESFKPEGGERTYRINA